MRLRIGAFGLMVILVGTTGCVDRKQMARDKEELDTLHQAVLRNNARVGEEAAQSREDLARARQALADGTAGMLSEGLAFYQEGKTIGVCESDYRDCRSKAKMATVTIPDLLTQRIEEHSLARDAMIAKGYQQIPMRDLPPEMQTVSVDGVTLAGRAGN